MPYLIDSEQLCLQKAGSRARIPDTFVWTKIQADAGQEIERILHRKELERQSGGTFWWGIGESKEKKIRLPAAKQPRPAVLFSLMRTAAHRRDRDPDGVLLWEAYVATTGEIELPAHAIVISRAHDSTGSPKSRYYALVCENPSGIPDSGGGTLDTGILRNSGDGGGPVGPSQITAVVERRSAPSGGLQYPITARATLVAPYAVTLAAPRQLSLGEKRLLDEASLEGKTSDDWMAVAKRLRLANSPEKPRPFKRSAR
jgi:hypothetical protein